MGPAPGEAPTPKGSWAKGPPRQQPAASAATTTGKHKEVQTVAELKALAAKLLGEDHPLVDQVGVAADTLRQEKRLAKPAWQQSQDDQRELDKKRRQLEQTKKGVKETADAIEALRTKSRELEQKAGQLEIEIAGLEAKVGKTLSLVKGEPVDLEAVVPSLGRIQREAAPPELEQAVEAAKEAIEKLRTAADEHARKEDERKRQEKEAQAAAATAANPANTESSGSGQPQENSRQQEPAAGEMEVDDETAAELAKDLFDDYDQKTPEEQANLKKKATTVIKKNAKKMRTSTASS